MSTDSLESLTDESSDKHQNVNSSSKVEQFLSETGLNAQLIARNDKKLVKLNVNTNKASNHSALNYNTNNLQHHSHAFMHDFDDAIHVRYLKTENFSFKRPRLIVFKSFMS